MSVKITVVGTGYVGLVSGACFAELGHDVICCDKDVRKIAMLERGSMPIYEPGLSEIVQRNVTAGRLKFSSDLGASVKGRSVIFVAVGTPSNGTNGNADLSFVTAAVEGTAANLDQSSVIVVKSTVPVGTNRRPFGSSNVPQPGGCQIKTGLAALRHEVIHAGGIYRIDAKNCLSISSVVRMRRQCSSGKA